MLKICMRDSISDVIDLAKYRTRRYRGQQHRALEITRQEQMAFGEEQRTRGHDDAGLEGVVLAVSSLHGADGAAVTEFLGQNSREDNVLFLSDDRHRTLGFLERPGRYTGVLERFGYVVPTLPENFPDYGNVPADAEALFMYRRERETIMYQACVVDEIMRARKGKKGVMLVSYRHLNDIASIDDDETQRIFDTRFEASQETNHSLVMQYIHSLMKEKRNIPKYRWITRKALDRQIDALMDTDTGIKGYAEYINECHTYRQRLMESHRNGRFKQHEPVKTTLRKRHRSGKVYCLGI